MLKFHEYRTIKLFQLLPVLPVMILLFVSADASSQLIRKSTVNFLSEDSLLITADHYYSRQEYPYILMFHTEKGSRGEYNDIAKRFVKMNYNCLAVDLRSGDKFAYIENETAKRAGEAGLSTNLEDSEKDMQAAIEYAKGLNNAGLFLLGSSFSASLCLKMAVNNPDINAVMAFSPGEFFRPETEIAKVIEGLDKRVFVTGSEDEISYILEMFEGQDPDKVTIYKPSSETSSRGTGLLHAENPASNEYWLAVLIFIKSFQN